MNSFEEFLKKNASDSVLELAQINVKDLGEWAIMEYINLGVAKQWHRYLLDSIIEQNDSFNSSKKYLLLKIGLSCLGEKMVSELLKGELK